MITINNTQPGLINDIEIYGNTIQDPNTLAIKSSGINQGDGTYIFSVFSCNKNLWQPNKMILGNAKDTYGYYKIDEKNAGKYKITIHEKDSSVDVSKVYFGITGNGNNANNGVSWALENGIVRNKGVSWLYHNDGYKCNYVSIHPNNKETLDKLMARYDIIVEKLDLSTSTQSMSNPTPYIPHEINKSNVLLPCVLDSFNGVKDRVYFDKDRGKWCIEKNIFSFVISGFGAWNKYPSWDTPNTKAYFTEIKGIPRKYGNSVSYGLSDIGNKAYYQFSEQVDIEGHYLNQLKNSLQINVSILNSSLNKEFVMKYQQETPEIIELPQGTQILLNSFADKTHVWVESGEVQATCKVIAPKSIHATVQSNLKAINNLNNRVSDISGLKESQDFEYESEGSLVCKNTKNSSVKDLKVYGKTLVNLCKTKNTLTVLNSLGDINIKLEPNTEYTIILDELLSDSNRTEIAFFAISSLSTTNVESGDHMYSLCVMDGKGIEFKMPKTSRQFSFTFKTNSAMIYGYFRGGGSIDTNLSVKNIRLIKGDHTKNPPPFFKGIKSVGEDVNEIEVSTRKEDGNLFDYSRVKLPSAITANGTTLTITNSYSNNIGFDLLNNLNLIPGETYTGSAEVTIKSGAFTNACGSLYLFKPNAPSLILINRTEPCKITVPPDFNPKEWSILIYGTTGDGVVEFKDITINKGTEVKPYTRFKQDTKPLLYHDTTTDTWKPIPMLCGKWEGNKQLWGDVLDSVKGKWYKRTKKVMLDGASVISADNTSVEGKKRWKIYANPNVKNVKTTDITTMNNLYNSVTAYGLYNSLLEGVTQNDHSNCLYLYLEKYSDGSDVSKQALLNEWATNPLEIIYETQEEVYDIAPITLDTFADETMISCSSGAIQASMDFKITSNINNTILENKKRIGALEDEIFKSKTLQNRILLNSTYSSDKVTFDVDTISPTDVKTKEELDYDLYNLIKKVVLVGKENYNKNDVIEMLDFYQLIGKFNWDMWDKIFFIIEEQHNPPIQPELPSPDLPKLSTNSQV